MRSKLLRRCVMRRNLLRSPMILTCKYLESEADETHRSGADELEATVTLHETLELLGQGDVLADVLLKLLDTVDAQHEPQLQSAEATSQRDLPVLKTQRTQS
jgi:hypothetical protein